MARWNPFDSGKKKKKRPKRKPANQGVGGKKGHGYITPKDKQTSRLDKAFDHMKKKKK